MNKNNKDNERIEVKEVFVTDKLTNKIFMARAVNDKIISIDEIDKMPFVKMDDYGLKEFMDILDVRLSPNSKDVPSHVAHLVSDNFWDLIYYDA